MPLGSSHRPLKLGIAAGVLATAAVCAESRRVAANPPSVQPVTFAAAAPVPAPHRVVSRIGPRRENRTAIVAHLNAPFPFEGVVPATGKPFIETLDDGRRAHRTRGGRIFLEHETFADNRVLLHIPAGFDVRRPGVIVVYFHGHGASLESDVVARQQLPRQVGQSGANAVLLAPQLAVNAADSSIGKLWEAGGLARLIDEAAANFGRLYGDPRAKDAFARLPVVVVAYSGGYMAAAWSAHHGALGRRMSGILLLDALYGETDKLADWIAGNGHGFLISAYTASTRRQNEAMRKGLAARGVSHLSALDRRLVPGTIAFIDTADSASHRDYVTTAWTQAPVSDVLARLPGFRRP